MGNKPTGRSEKHHHTKKARGPFQKHPRLTDCEILPRRTMGRGFGLWQRSFALQSALELICFEEKRAGIQKEGCGNQVLSQDESYDRGNAQENRTRAQGQSQTGRGAA
jgi:hypothetical protein